MAKLTLKHRERKRIDRGIYARGRSDGTVEYEIRFRYRGRDIRETAGSTLTLARQALAIRKAALAKGRYGIRLASRASPLFSTFAMKYVEYAKLHKKTWASDQDRIRWLAVQFGKCRLADIDVLSVERYKADRSKNVSPRTVNLEVWLIKRMMKLAEQWGDVEKNPLLGVRSVRMGPRRERVLTHDEERRLVASTSGHMRDLIILCLNTGLRRNELLSLRSTDVNLSARILSVRTGKTGLVRVVPLNELAFSVVARRARGGPLFTYRGKPIKRFYVAWWAALRRAGIEGLTFHDLRHSFSSRLAAMGVHPKIAQELLGHTNQAMTANYTHPSLELKREAVQALESGPFSVHSPDTAS